MKHIQILLYILVLTTFSCTENTVIVKNDLEARELNGPVKSVETFGLEKHNDNERYTCVEYTDSGFVIRDRHGISVFDEEGFIIKLITPDHVYCGSLDTTSFITKFKANKLYERQYYDSDDTSEILNYHYDKSGNVDELLGYDKSRDTIQFREKYEYDKSNNRILSTRFNHLGILCEIKLFEYDLNNNLVLSKTIDSCQSYTDINEVRYSLTYNNQNQLIEKIKLPFEKEVYEYDTSNRIIKIKRTYNEENHTEIEKRFYDNKGNLILLDFTYEKDSVIEKQINKFKYDKYQNRTEARTIVDDSIVYIIINKYEYY